MTAKKLGWAPRCEIVVTDEEIKRGVRRDSSHCVAAEAVRSRFPDAKYVSVDLQTIRWSDSKKGERYTYLTPRSVQEFLVKFDQGYELEPFTFKLRNGQTTRSGRQHSKGKALLRKPKNGSGAGTSVPDRVGGKPPPVSKSPISIGMRREFGLRALKI
jgi:hypothetical protein